MLTPYQADVACDNLRDRLVLQSRCSGRKRLGLAETDQSETWSLLHQQPGVQTREINFPQLPTLDKHSNLHGDTDLFTTFHAGGDAPTKSDSSGPYSDENRGGQDSIDTGRAATITRSESDRLSRIANR